MNCGLGTLDQLKTALLPDSMRGDTQFDAMIATIGKGVAASFDQICNRNFARVEDATDEFECNRSYACLTKYPIEEITKVEFRYTAAGGWEEQPVDDVVMNRSDKSGLIDFNYIVGPNISRLRVTYTGGYWFNTLEPTDTGYPEEMPDTAFPLPADLFDAWLEQSQFMFTERDMLGQKGIKKQGKESLGSYRFAEIGILEHVSGVLSQYVRFAS